MEPTCENLAWSSEQEILRETQETTTDVCKNNIGICHEPEDGKRIELRQSFLQWHVELSKTKIGLGWGHEEDCEDESDANHDYL